MTFQHRQTVQLRQSGFALVVTLALMAFIFLLLVTLATTTQVEIATQSNQAATVHARENARLAVMLALAQMQQSVGPDKRVTARADITNLEDIRHRYWFGVWDAEDQSLVTWLVSGNGNTDNTLAFNPDDTIDDSCYLMGVKGESGAVEVPIIDVTNQQGATEGHYAYWVSDEGIKARLNLEDSGWSASQVSDQQIARQVSERLGIESTEVWSAFQSNQGDVNWGRALARLGSSEALPVLYEQWNSGDSTGIDWLAQHHDVTLVSNLLPVDTFNGGLKKDLSLILEPGFNTASYQDADPIIENADAPMITWGALRSFANPWSSWDDASLGQVVPKAPSTTQAGLFPLLVQVQMGWGAIRSGVAPGASLLLTMKPVVVLANPYDVALAPTTYQVAWTPDTGRGLMMLTFDPEPRPGTAAFLDGVHTRPLEFYPNNLLGEYPTLTILNASFQPGEIKVFSPRQTAAYPTAGSGGVILENAYPSSNYAWKDTGRALGSNTRGPDGKITMQISGGKLTLDYRMLSGSEWLPLQSIQEIGIGMSPTASQVVDPGQPKVQVSLEPSGGSPLPPSINLIRRRLEMRSSADYYVSDAYSGSGLRWLADFNPRAYGANARPPDWISHPLWLSDAGNTNNQLPLNSDWLVDFQLNSSGEAQGYWGPATDAAGESVVTLFSVPRTPILSLGFLQHAPMGLRVWDPAYPFGNSYASPFTVAGEKDLSYELNETFWDSYFFSGLTQDTTTGTWDSLNGRVLMTDDSSSPVYADFQTSAAGVFIQGGFNVNSTSLEAWKAFLSNFGGQTISYYDTEKESTENASLSNSFFRTINPNGGADTDWRGYHELSSEQIERLAAHIIYRIRERGEPFFSLQEFVNRPLGGLSGLLQEAIDSDEAVTVYGVEYPPTGINEHLRDRMVENYDSAVLPNPQASLGARSTGAPGWLTQADILTALGPTIAVRSDTFIIRAYGDYCNPVTGEILGTAQCEAVVQRLPTPVTPLDPDSSSVDHYTPKDEFGRQLRIVDFKWID